MDGTLSFLTSNNRCLQSRGNNSVTSKLMHFCRSSPFNACAHSISKLMASIYIYIYKLDQKSDFFLHIAGCVCIYVPNTCTRDEDRLEYNQIKLQMLS